jgi:hypothetical protein
VISFRPELQKQVAQLARDLSAPLTVLGKTGGGELAVSVEGRSDLRVRLPLEALANAWQTGFCRAL